SVSTPIFTTSSLTCASAGRVASASMAPPNSSDRITFLPISLSGRLRRAPALFASKTLGLQPGDDQGRDLVAVVLAHRHMAVAGDAALRQRDDFGAEMAGRRFVDRARMARVRIAGDDQDRMGRKCRGIPDPQALTTDIEALVHQSGALGHDRTPIGLEGLFRE